MKPNSASHRVSFRDVTSQNTSGQSAESVLRSISQGGTGNANSPSANVTNFNRGRLPSSNYSSFRIKPLTQLKPEPGAEVQRHVTQSPERLRDSDGGLETSHGQRYQSEHSRRGSMSSETYASANSNQATGLHSASTSQASLPNLTLGTRVRSEDPQSNDTTSPQIGPHPYDLILPGQEVRRPPVKIRTVSNVTQSTVGLSRSVSLSNRNKTMSIGSRRFTQTAESPISGGGTLSAVGTSNQAAALHARRFSTIARDPSVAIVSPNLSAAGNNNESVNITEGQKQAQVDCKMFIVSLRSLLGRDGGGEAVGRLLAFILRGGLELVRSEIIGLLKHVMNNVPSLDAAYVTVHFHEIIKQLINLGGLLVAEVDIGRLLENARQRFQGLMSPLTSPPPNFSIYEIFNAIMQKLFDSPVYQSALLNLVDTVCKFLIASESLRDGVWTTLSQSLQSQPSSNGNQITGIAEFLNLLFAAVEQITGGPVKPLIKNFLSWIAIADDLLTKLATETQEFLSKPFPVSVTAPGDYVLHPFGYVYSPTESAAKLKTVFLRWTDAFTLDTHHKEAFDHFSRTFVNVISGIMGNSTFARFSRDILRVWRGILGDASSGTAGTGLEGALEFFKALASELIEISLEAQKIKCADSEVEVSAIKLKMASILPSEINFSTNSKLIPPNFTFQSTTKIELKNLQLTSKEIEFSYTIKNQHDSRQSGTFMVDFNFDLSVGFVPKGEKLFTLLSSLPYYEKTKVSVTASRAWPTGTGNRGIVDVLWSQIRNQMADMVKMNLEGWADRLFTSWLAAKPETKPSLVNQAPTNNKDGRPQVGAVAPAQISPEVYATARDRFKASVRNLTGIKTGAVLSQLQNPFSGPPSPVVSPGPDEDIDTKRKRRQSMAEYLTDVSRLDSTLPENIQRPPVAENQKKTTSASNLPNVFDDDEDELPMGYETMARSLSFSARKDTTSIDKIVHPVLSSKADLDSVLSHRGVLSSFPTGELSYEAYRRAEAELGGHNSTPLLNVGCQEVASMAQSLSELATRDSTTEDAIANPPTADVSSTQNSTLSSNNMTMDRVTRHLSGLGDLPKEGDENVATSRIVRAGGHQPELNTKVVMADLLTSAAKEDHTLPETQATGQMSGPVEALGVPTNSSFTSLSPEERIPMRKALSRDSCVDTTLTQNIACPPGTGISHRTSAQGQFTGLKSVRSMSRTLDAEIERDFTTPESQAEMHKIYHQINSPQTSSATGLTEQEMKMRRKSFKLSEEAMRDTTLVDNIRRPPRSSFASDAKYL
ncbi:hypothetical protein BY996DRAFT_7143216 [Phakopsora pachyrhizi]|uniref:Uncharacterized protein n=1 Tax=Phakopsora pachyrhizi TaxID=170000 RepID=A0AAV0BNE7_PHAPC|nr:hypothetical protein BY996DRAFT_7143216 [Phakopsora pachyrhizi]CAH7687068.1 hypothetical protein PPACK8108_LOCUS21800 [Phakopsora pachyrhizi]